MYSLIACVLLIILCFIAHEKNFFKYGIFIGIMWSYLQMLKAAEEIYVGFLAYGIMLVVYIAFAILLGMFLRNITSKISYVVTYFICYNIGSYAIFYYLIINMLIAFNS